MRLEHIAGAALDHLFGRLLRRALLCGVLALFALIAVYHFTVAGTLALEAQYGMLYARLIIAGIYAALAAITLIILWATHGKSAKAASAPALAAPREMQIAMLVEAVMLGYSLASKRERAR